MGERGVGLIEIMVAITILSVVLLALGSLMFQATRDMNRSGAVAYRSAAQQSSAAWGSAFPWDSLHAPPGGPVGCVTDTAGLLIYNRCTTLFTLTKKLKRLMVVISPTGRLTAPPDTLWVDRTKPLVGSPFH